MVGVIGRMGRIGRVGSSRPVQGVPQPPPGFALIIHNGSYVIDASGRYVIVEIA